MVRKAVEEPVRRTRLRERQRISRPDNIEKRDFVKDDTFDRRY